MTSNCFGQKFATVYPAIYCRKFLTSSNQMSRYKSMCIRIQFWSNVAPRSLLNFDFFTICFHCVFKICIMVYSVYMFTYQSPLILTALFQHNLINVSYLTACYLYQVMMTLHFCMTSLLTLNQHKNKKLRHNR